MGELKVETTVGGGGFQHLLRHSNVDCLFRREGGEKQARQVIDPTIPLDPLSRDLNISRNQIPKSAQKTIPLDPPSLSGPRNYRLESPVGGFSGKGAKKQKKTNKC